MGMGIDDGKPAMEIDADEFFESSASPTCSTADIDALKRAEIELATAIIKTKNLYVENRIRSVRRTLIGIRIVAETAGKSR